ncbi:MAG TPA: AMP-binding protein, partial [Acidimicrobiales bacterium]|nr:AMP-binding protein [Acidimicrobiales bacterium]
LAAWNATATAYPRDVCLHELIEAQVDRAPGAVALSFEGRTLTYAELDERVAELAGRLGRRRRLVLLGAANTVDCVVAYLAALRGRHPVLLVPGDTASPSTRSTTASTLAAAYDPDVVMTAETGWQVDGRPHAGSAHDLHPDLALLLTTSGSTGSSKLVRLSHGNVRSNALAIAEYLRLTPDDRAITTLPLQYCYGLSVLNSHLAAGASLALTTLSVVDRCFWDVFRSAGATSFAGVPHTFDLLDRTGFEERSASLPTLRYVTQAGGRLHPDAVRRYAALGRRDGWELFVMYGQTEATARMAWLPPALATAHPHTIGVAIPGGSFSIDGPDADGVGELVYRGPNVMLGYAEAPADLGLGATLDALATGDLARVGPEGLYEVVGRRSRFVKLFGLRLDLDQVERRLADRGLTALCTGDDQRVMVAIGPDDHHDPAAVRAMVGELLALPRSRIVVVAVDDLPRLANGKPDYAAVQALAAAGVAGLASVPAPGRGDGATGAQLAATATERDAGGGDGATGAPFTATATERDAGRGDGATAARIASSTAPTHAGRQDGPTAAQVAADPTREDVGQQDDPEAVRARPASPRPPAVATPVATPADTMISAPAASPASTSSAHAAHAAHTAHAARATNATPATPVPPAVLHAFTEILGRAPAGDDTFVGLGGDSLSYVEMSIRLEEVLGTLPADWATTPVAALTPPSSPGGRPPRHRLVARTETSVVLRAMAIVLVVGNHTDVWHLLGGAHTMVAVAGYNTARFLRDARGVLAGVARLALPSMAWIAVVAAASDDFDWRHAALLNGALGGDGRRWTFWYVEALVQILLAVALLLAVPAARRLERRRPLAFPLGLTAAGLLLRFDLLGAAGVHHRWFRPWELVWLFALGWAAARAGTTRARLAVTAVTLAVVPGAFGGNVNREFTVGAGLLLLLWARHLPVPRPLHRMVGAVAGASLFVYLTHAQLYPPVVRLFGPTAGPAAGLVAAVLAGVAAWTLGR